MAHLPGPPLNKHPSLRRQRLEAELAGRSASLEERQHAAALLAAQQAEPQVGRCCLAVGCRLYRADLNKHQVYWKPIKLLVITAGVCG